MSPPGRMCAPRRRGLVPPIVAIASVALAGSAGADSLRLIDTDMPGFDYRHFDLPRSSPRLCQEACFGDETCRAWTFVKAGFYGDAHAACWLKNRVPDVHSDPCCISGSR